jgi:hypothetical protein
MESQDMNDTKNMFPMIYSMLCALSISYVSCFIFKYYTEKKYEMSYILNTIEDLQLENIFYKKQFRRMFLKFKSIKKYVLDRNNVIENKIKNIDRKISNISKSNKKPIYYKRRSERISKMKKVNYKM